MAPERDGMLSIQAFLPGDVGERSMLPILSCQAEYLSFKSRQQLHKYLRLSSAEEEYILTFQAEVPLLKGIFLTPDLWHFLAFHLFI